MTATHRNLHELLKEDQEPFLLNKYIAERRSQLKPPTKTTTLQPRKRKSIVESSRSKRSLCKNACFLSFHESPVSDFPSPATVKRTPNRVRLQIPARTTAMLLEAAMKIQKQSSKPRSLSVGFGLIGSILMRLSKKNRSRKCEISRNGFPIFSPGKTGKVVCEKIEENFDYENSRRNSTVWSESNGEEDKSMDLTSTSTRSDDSEVDFAGEQLIDDGGFSFSEKHFCSSPLSPFRFALERYPSPGRRTPIFSSPATSPIRHHNQMQGNEDCDQERIQKTLQHEEEEEKEQCSPVSVLDRQSEDYDDVGHEDEDDEVVHDMESSYASVQRSRLQLLRKLRRFEKLAELDPVELEKRMLEEYCSEDESDQDDDSVDDKENNSSTGANSFLIEAVLRQSSGLHFSKVSSDMKRLVLDLVEEEESEWDGSDEGVVVTTTRVCERLDSWNEVQSNTIDMMVELDLRRQVDGWQREDKEQVRETSIDIEVIIFGLLIEELSEELGLAC